MKNYLVRATKSFNDYDGADVNDPNNNYKKREANISEWKVTKERYEYLKENNAVVLLGIDKKEETKKAEPKIVEIIDTPMGKIGYGKVEVTETKKTTKKTKKEAK